MDKNKITRDEILICIGRIDANRELGDEFVLTKTEWLLEILTQLIVYMDTEQIIQNKKLVPDEKAKLN
jgi:hypothetical protein